MEEKYKMKELKVFILDLDVRSGHGIHLRDILQSCRSPRIHVEANHLGTENGVSAAGPVGDLLFGSHPDLIFLVSGGRSPGARSLIQALHAKVQCPIAAVTGTEGAGQAVSLHVGEIVDSTGSAPHREDVLSFISRFAERKSLDDSLLKRCRERIALTRMIGDDEAFSAEIQKIPIVASCDASVLISGETGTGKELCARAVHYLSSRMDKPFVPVNCGALPLDLIENELFGHEKGAFTSASRSYPGMIQEADGGTLFLDEIDSLPFQAQSKLLRLLQDGEYRSLGAAKLRHADVRIIAATNADLRELVAANRFRSDLYYRLNIIPIHLPPLRERKGDIPLLAETFLRKYAAKYKSAASRISDEALARLCSYDWPGNIRELENLMHRVVVFCQGEVVERVDLPGSTPEPGPVSFKEAKTLAVRQFERKYLHELLLAHGGNISKAARSAGKHRRAFWELIRKHEMNTEDYLPQIGRV
jgi:DNA-binding NtrC family response regulator